MVIGCAEHSDNSVRLTPFGYATIAQLLTRSRAGDAYQFSLSHSKKPTSRNLRPDRLTGSIYLNPDHSCNTSDRKLYLQINSQCPPVQKIE